MRGRRNDDGNGAGAGNLITEEMADWAHEVRLDANNPRHADDNNPLPSTSDADRTVQFAQALALRILCTLRTLRRGSAQTSPLLPGFTLPLAVDGHHATHVDAGMSVEI